MLLQNETFYLTCWMDNKTIYMLSYSKTCKVSLFRNSSTGGECERVIIDQLLLATTEMDGTDLNDQSLLYYRMTVQAKKMPTKIMTHFLMVSIVNSYTIYKFSHMECTLLTFINELLDDVEGLKCEVYNSNDPLVYQDEDLITYV